MLSSTGEEAKTRSGGRERQVDDPLSRRPLQFLLSLVSTPPPPCLFSFPLSLPSSLSTSCARASERTFLCSFLSSSLPFFACSAARNNQKAPLAAAPPLAGGCDPKREGASEGTRSRDGQVVPAIFANPREILSFPCRFVAYRSGSIRQEEFERKGRKEGHGRGGGDAGGAAARRGGPGGRRHGQAQLRDILDPREQVPVRLHRPAPAVAAQAGAGPRAGVRGGGGAREGGAAREGLRAVRGRRRRRAPRAARRPRAGAPGVRAPPRVGGPRRPRRRLLRPRRGHRRGRRVRRDALLHALPRRAAVPRRRRVAPRGGPRAAPLPRAARRGRRLLPVPPRQEAAPGGAHGGARGVHEGHVRRGAHPAGHHQTRPHLLLRPQDVRAARLLPRRRPGERELRLPPLRRRPRRVVRGRTLRARRGGVGRRRHVLRRRGRRAHHGQPRARRHHPRAPQQARVPLRPRRRGPPRALRRRLLRRGLRRRRRGGPPPHAPVGPQGVGAPHRPHCRRRRRRPGRPRRGARLRAMPLVKLPPHSGEAGEHAAVPSGRGVRPDTGER